MSGSRPPYHRRTTKQMPRPELPNPPASARSLEQDSIETLVACPWCEGHGMVTPETNARWRANYPEVADKEPIVP